MTKKLRLMQAAATALWGPQYRSEMARQLGVQLRTAMSWDRAERPVPDIMLARLSKLLQMRQLEISKVLENMPKVSS
jgi:hypothetical protein